ncbi:MAG: T9SS type A sorting domain-containing protein [Bacteroidota bacterium]|nr:T9SS type A sorting domain-containing protein [Bacteroidota bacterium]
MVILAISFAMPSRADDQLRKKIGQMIVLGFNGTTLDDSLRVDLAQRNLGGVILLGGNCTSPQQVQQLTASIRAAAITPPLIAIDEEGGKVARLNQYNGFAKTYTAYTLGSVFQSLDSTAKQAALMASWLSECGINVNFAPVVDVDVNPTSPAIGAYGRSFSPIPDVVAEHAERFIDGFHAQHIITTLKHFPGHGSATADSHFNLPDITNTWADSELVPYRFLLAAHKVDLVMVGHLFNAKIDSLYPSSLSYNTITGLLRDSLGYNGAVITDDLYNMEAITANFDFSTTVEHAINGGNDMLLYIFNLDQVSHASLCEEIIDTVEAMVNRGVIAESRIDDAYNHIQQLKNAYLPMEVASHHGGTIPTSITLSNYPNPFNPVTRVRFETPVSGFVTLKVYDVLGREIATLVSENARAGKYEIPWNAAVYPSGVYFCVLQEGNQTRTAKLMLVK